MKIVNKGKFLRSIVLMVSIIAFMFLFFNSNETLSHKEILYKEIYASAGDTLWVIAKDEVANNLYYENKDLRDVIKDIKKINNLSNSNLAVGQKLLIPSF